MRCCRWCNVNRTQKFSTPLPQIHRLVGHLPPSSASFHIASASACCFNGAGESRLLTSDSGTVFFDRNPMARGWPLHVTPRPRFLFRDAERKKIFDTKTDSFSSTSASPALRELKVNGLGLSPTCQSLGALARWSLLIRKGSTMSYYAYLGPLGEIVRHGASFLASKDGFLIGTYNTFGGAM